MNHAAALVAAAILLAPLAARADEAQTEPERRWYGADLIIADALVTSVMVIGAGSRSGSLMTIGAAGYLAVPPVIHAAHRNGLEAVGSLAIRVALPLVAARVGAEVCLSSDATDNCVGHALLGMAAGAGVAMILDAALLARREVRPARAREAAWTVGAAPRVEGGWTLALGGAF